ncbi:hypothetical protein HII12_001065 [Brettanomyces bruxellensis]|uniref:Histone chaperone RTT106 n=1 Tax=Dekkera bruxellensis TaxID=5007 RepID=A0A8H6BP57_DEKBR|nr:hypothetical protein HII12_001065 [Brettanomyces bruxellensis]
MTLASLPSQLQNDITALIKKDPESETTIKQIIEYYEGKLTEVGKLNHKKLKTDNAPTQTSSADRSVLPQTLEGSQIMLQIPDLSIQSPFRKKVNMVIGAFKGKAPFMTFTKAMNNPPEFMLDDLTAKNINFTTILHVPEKKASRVLLISYKQNLGHLYKDDPLLVQFNNDILTEQFGSILNDTTLVSFLLKQLSALGMNTVDGTTEDVFFVQTYNVTKEGYLYFLKDYIIFGFKKPILIFKTADIEAVTYTSITRLTFNVSLNVRHPVENSENGNNIQKMTTEKYEFSMIDQKEFDKINQYVQSQKFEDKSMADELKAQRQLKSGSHKPGALTEAAKLVPGGDIVVGSADGEENNDDDEELDADYELGDSDDDHSDDSEESDNEEAKSQSETDKEIVGNSGMEKETHDDEDDSPDYISGEEVDENGEEYDNREKVQSDDDDREMDEFDDQDNGEDDTPDESKQTLEQELKDLENGLDDTDYLQMADYTGMS